MKERLKPDERRTRTWLLPLLAFIWNAVAYAGTKPITQGWHHYDMTLAVDDMIPFLPWTVAIYFGCYLFWAANYVLAARQDKAAAYRFYCADFLSRILCAVFFLLLPTTNVRPAVEGSGIWNWLMRLLYQADTPYNLFPSIHCLVSWLCWIAVRRCRDIPRWYRWFSLFAAIVVCISTVTTKQHVLVDVAGGILAAELSYWAAGRRPIARIYERAMDWLVCRV